MKTKRKILYSALFLTAVPNLSSCLTLTLLGRMTSPCANWISTNFLAFTKWISDDGNSVMYCMTNRYKGYGYAYKDGERQLFIWDKNVAKDGDGRIDLRFYFPNIDRYAYMAENSVDDETISITRKPHPTFSSCKFEWTSTLKKVEISEEEIDVRYAGKTHFINEELSLNFYNTTPIHSDNGIVHAYVFSNTVDFYLKLDFTDQYHFKMEEGERSANGTCKLTKKELIMTFETDEIYGHPGENFTFKFEDGACLSR